MIHRTLSNPLDKISLERELNSIKNIANNNHSNNNTIHSLMNKKKKQLILKRIFQTSNTEIKDLKYAKMTISQKNVEIVSNNEIKIAFQTFTNISKL